MLWDGNQLVAGSHICVEFTALRSFSFKCLTSERHMWTEQEALLCSLD